MTESILRVRSSSSCCSLCLRRIWAGLSIFRTRSSSALRWCRVERFAVDEDDAVEDALRSVHEMLDLRAMSVVIALRPCEEVGERRRSSRSEWRRAPAPQGRFAGRCGGQQGDAGEQNAGNARARIPECAVPKSCSNIARMNSP